MRGSAQVMLKEVIVTVNILRRLAKGFVRVCLPLPRLLILGSLKIIQVSWKNRVYKSINDAIAKDLPRSSIHALWKK